jgi:hypothetical protein
MVPRTSYALKGRDFCNTWIDDTRATNASEVRITHVWHACVTCCRSSILRTPHAEVVHMMRASYARHSSSKCDVKRAGSTHHTRCTRRGKCVVSTVPVVISSIWLWRPLTNIFVDRFLFTSTSAWFCDSFSGWIGEKKVTFYAVQFVVLHC